MLVVLSQFLKRKVQLPNECVVQDQTVIHMFAVPAAVDAVVVMLNVHTPLAIVIAFKSESMTHALPDGLDTPGVPVVVELVSGLTWNLPVLVPMV